MNRILLLLMLGISSLAAAGESGTALKDDTLRKEPFSDAAVAGNVSRNDKVEILERKGAWIKIKSQKSSGWVRMLSIRRGETGKAGGSGVLGLASGRSGTGQVVATTGIRGLNEEELKAAKFNESEINLMESNTISADTAQQFAAAAGLQSRKLDELPAQVAGAASPSATQGFSR